MISRFIPNQLDLLSISRLYTIADEVATLITRKKSIEDNLIVKLKYSWKSRRFLKSCGNTGPRFCPNSSLYSCFWRNRENVFILLFLKLTNWEITTTWYYVNSKRHVNTEKAESQMGFEPTTLRDLVGCTITELLETLWWARVKLWVLTGTASRGYTAH